MEKSAHALNFMSAIVMRIAYAIPNIHIFKVEMAAHINMPKSTMKGLWEQSKGNQKILNVSFSSEWAFLNPKP